MSKTSDEPYNNKRSVNHLHHRGNVEKWDVVFIYGAYGVPLLELVLKAGVGEELKANWGV